VTRGRTRGWRPAARFLAYGLAGSVAEALFTSAIASVGAGRIVRRGPSTLLMVPLYGLALPLFEPIHDRVRGRPAWQRGAIYAAGILAVEALTGLVWRRWTGRVPWEYRSGIAVAGVTRLDYAPAWAIVGLAAERLHDTLTERRPSNDAGELNASLVHAA
jgi:Putative ABC-transporter type IV